MSAEPVESVPLPPFRAELLTLVKNVADHDLSRDIWDEEPPALWVITGSSSPLGQTLLGTTELPVPERVWRAAPPSHVLAYLAETLGPPPSEIVDSIRAVMMSAESWELNHPETATEQEKQTAIAFAKKRGIADHPWGVEIKATFAVDTDGWCHFATRRRKDGEGNGYSVPPDAGREVTGAIPHGLRALLRTIRGESS